MKLIHHLERKLSWRKKQSGVQATNGPKADKGRKSKKVASAAIKVSDNEFSQYIRFASLLRPMPTNSVPSYEIVNIRTRSPFQASTLTNQRVVAPVLSSSRYQSPSPGREAEYDTHIYDRIDCNRPISPVQYDPALDRKNKYGSVGPTTVTSTCRRNRIKTNPWCSSPWANRKSFNGTNKPAYTNIENPYESIDSLAHWQESKENSTSHQLQPIYTKGYHTTQSATNHHLKQYSPNRTPERASLGEHRTNTYLKSRTPHHLDASYPQSTFDRPIETDQFVAQAPSPEFLNESHQICSEISHYFRPSPHQSPIQKARCVTASTTGPPMVVESQLNKFDSMETIDLTTDLNDDYADQAMASVWSLAEDSIQEQDTTISSGMSSWECSPKSRKTLDTRHIAMSNNAKRKRPESIYSTRQLKKVDKLKSQLKEVVHAAILKAKKEDTKRA